MIKQPNKRKKANTYWDYRFLTLFWTATGVNVKQCGYSTICSDVYANITQK